MTPPSDHPGNFAASASASAAVAATSRGTPRGVATHASRSHWAALAIVLGLAALAWLAFGDTRRHGFINFDDDVYVYDNRHVTPGLTGQGIAWATTAVYASNWHPLTWLSHMLDCQLYGLAPAGHHVTSVLLHAATAILLFLVLRELTGAMWRSGFVAAVFAIHPLRVESVAWIAERKDVLSGAFFMLTLLAYGRYVRRGRSVGGYCAVAAMLALGLMSKPMLVTTPFVLLLLDFWPLERIERGAALRSLRRLVVEKLPLLALVAAACGTTLLAQKEAIAPMALAARLGNAALAYVTYLAQMVYPARLAVYYPHPGNAIAAWRIAGAVTVLTAISAVAVALRRKQPWVLFGWLWFLGMMVPVVGVVQVGSQAHADRYTYLPQIGLYVAMAWSAAAACARWRGSPAVLATAGGAILATLLLVTRTQVAYWQTSETLWRRTLACTAENLIAHDNLGTVLLAQGNVDEAIVHFEAALRIDADHAKAHNNLGNALLQKLRLDDAIGHFQRALALKPDYAEAYNNLGVALIRGGRPDQAIDCFRRALQILPDYAFAHNSLGQALLEQGKPEEAIPCFAAALRLDPAYAEAYYNFGNAFLKQGKIDDAIARFRHAIELKPGYADAENNLGYALLQKGDLRAAGACFEKTLQAQPANVNAHYNLGTALLMQDQLEPATVHFREVLRLDPAASQAGNNLAYILFRQGRLREGAAQYERVLERNPDNVSALSNLAWVRATAPTNAMRDGSKALELAERANRLTDGTDPAILRTVAAALAENARFDEATNVAKIAVQLANARSNVDLVAALEDQLKTYGQRAAFRDPSLKEAAQ